MENKPVFYDGSNVQENSAGEQKEVKLINFTEEVRKNIGVNPYTLDS